MNYYYPKKECINFSWVDSGIDPEINGRGISVICDNWSTADGLHVGSSFQDVNARIHMEFCASKRSDGSLIISTKEGIWFEGRDRNSPVSIIWVMPVTNSWEGMCKD